VVGEFGISARARYVPKEIFTRLCEVRQVYSSLLIFILLLILSTSSNVCSAIVPRVFAYQQTNSVTMDAQHMSE